MMRLDKFLAHCSIGTRNEVKKIIRKGHVMVNGSICKQSDAKIDEDKDVIALNNQRLLYEKYSYVVLNKPKDYICSTIDEHYPSVLNLVEEDYASELFIVGRLDVDSVGMVLLSNDGALAHEILSPKKHIEKEYIVEVLNPLSLIDIELLSKGITLDDGPCKPCVVSEVEGTRFHITIVEGRFHQIKRMMHAIKNEVIYLKRIRMGKLCLPETLEEGSYYVLENQDVLQLTAKED